MKILNIIPTLDATAGGIVEGVSQISSHLATLGVHTTVASLDCPSSVWLRDRPFKAIGLGPVFANYGYRRNLPCRIRQLAMRHDVTIVHGIWQYHSFATWRALHRSAIPYFVYTHGMLDPWFKNTYPLKHFKKSLYWPMADYRVLRDAKGVLFTTEQERLLARQSFRLYRANEFVVGYGTSTPPGNVDFQRELFLRHYPHLRGLRIFLFLSRIHPKKGLDMLIEAFSSVTNNDPLLHLVIAGPDQFGWQAKLQRRITELNISDRITWLGMVSGDLKWGAYFSAELFCLPSHQENFGIVVAEALACGLPVSIAEPVNISQEVADAGAGIVHSDTLIGTTSALREWLFLTNPQQRQMGHSGKMLFYDRFDFASVAKNLLSLLSA